MCTNFEFTLEHLTLIVTTVVPGGESSATDVLFNKEINLGILSFWSPTVIWTKQVPDLK